MSYLVQILLPTADNTGTPYSVRVFESIKQQLVDNFGGVTAHTQAPAEGVWAPGGGRESRENIVIVEVMAPELDDAWWARFRKTLENDLAQNEVLIRAQQIRKL